MKSERGEPDNTLDHATRRATRSTSLHCPSSFEIYSKICPFHDPIPIFPLSFHQRSFATGIVAPPPHLASAGSQIQEEKGNPNYPAPFPSVACHTNPVRVYVRTCAREQLGETAQKTIPSSYPSLPSIMSYGGGYPPYGRKWHARLLGRRNLISRGAS